MLNMIKVPGRGTTVVLTGGVGLGDVATFDLTHLAAKDRGGRGGIYTYLRELVITITGNVKNTNVASRTIEWQQFYNLLNKVVLNADGHNFVDCPTQGGMILRHWEETSTGRKASCQTDITQAGSGTNGGILAYTLVYRIPCYDLRRYEPEDLLIPVSILDGANLDLQFCPSTQFGADMSIDTATIRVDAEIVQRDEWRVPALWTIREHRQSSVDDFVEPSLVTYQDLHVIAAKTAGLTRPKITSANVTTVKHEIDGDVHKDQLPPDSLISAYNGQVSFGDNLLPLMGTGNCERIPVLWVSKSSGKITKFAYANQKSKLTLEGTASADTTFRLMSVFQRSMTHEAVEQIRQRAKVAAKPGAKIAPKTASKVGIDARKPKKGAALPHKLTD